uniref:Uncharacterized protein n=1 Tax=Manihot esculenta TaxID=3983 RepID=A0A2C9UN48_MANES
MCKRVKRAIFRELADVFFKFTCNSDCYDNNMCEAFNGSTILARSKYIVSMLVDIRVPAVVKRLEANMERAFDYHMEWNGDMGFKVFESKERHVNIQNQTCMCRPW